MESTSLGTDMQIGAYQIDAVLGMGSGTRVFDAHDARGQRVAVKVFESVAGSGASDALARRDHEVSMHHRAGDEGLAALLDSGEDTRVGPYLVTRFAEGPSLRTVAHARPLLPEHVSACLVAIARTLAALHARLVVHGDVKPEHVRIDREGEVVLLDLGLAFELGGSASTPGINGTLGYVAPEVFEGLAASAAVDVFALGVLAHELLVGWRPFEQTVDGRTEGAPARLDETDRRISAELAAIVERCLAKSPRDRPRADELVVAFERATELTLPEHAPALAELVADRRAAEVAITRRTKSRLVERANRTTRDGDPFEATRLLDRALAYAPDDPEVLAALDVAMSAPGKKTRRLSRRTLGIGTLAAIALVLLAGLAITSQRPPPASRAEALPAPTASRTTLGFEPLPAARLPNATLVQGQSRERDALRALDARVRTRPRDVDLRLRRAAARMSLGRQRDAHADLLVLLAAHPDDERTLRALVSLYDRLGESARTAPLLERIVARHPRDASALTDLSIAYGQGPRADDAIARAYALAPRDARVLARRCSLAVHATASDAMVRCDEAYRRSTRDPFLLADRAEAYLRAGDLARARESLDAAIALRPEDATFLFRREAIERALGNEDAARASHEAACRLAPDPRCGPA